MQETAVYVIIAISVAYGMIKIHKLIKEHNDPCKGCSGCALKTMRAPKGFHCMDFLADFDGFLKCGGHEQAAGMTIDPQRYEDFKEYVLQKGRAV